MMKWFPAGFALVLFLGGQVLAGEPNEDLGRYQVIPDALVPGKNGVPQKRTLLLDSVTGLTWVFTRHPKARKGAAPQWVPIETNDLVAPSATPKPKKKPKPAVSKPAEEKSYYRTNRLDRRFHNYDSNP